MKKYYNVYRSSTTSGKHKARERHISGLMRQFDINYGRFLPSDKGARIIDLGCGAGELVHWLGRAGYSNVAGYDISKEQVEEARCSFPGDFVCVNLLNEDFEFPPADIYFLRDVLEHFDKDEVDLVFKKIRQSALNSTLVIQTANGSSRYGVVTFFSDYTHKTLFTERSLAQVISANLNASVEFYPWHPVGDNVISILRTCFIFIQCQFDKLLSSVHIGTGNCIYTSNFIASVKVKGDKSS